MSQAVLFAVSQADVFHVASRFSDRVYHFGSDDTKDQFLKTRAWQRCGWVLLSGNEHYHDSVVR